MISKLRRVVSLCVLALVFLPLSGWAQGGGGGMLVQVADIQERPIKEDVTLVGNVQPIRESLVASQLDGLIQKRLVDDGAIVHKGEVLVELDRRRIERAITVAEAEVAEAEARLKRAAAAEKRSKELIAQKMVAEDRLEEDVANRAVVEAQKRKEEGELADLQDDRERAAIRAPFDAVITELNVEVGQWLGRGAPVARLADLSTVEIQVDIPERYYASLAVGQEVKITIDALQNFEMVGKIHAVVPRASAATRTFPVLVRAENPDHRIAAGMLARVQFLLGDDTPVLLVPKDALVRQPQGQVIYIYEENKANMVPVRALRSSGEWIQVESDVELRAGQRVITRGNERLRPGQNVRVSESEPPQVEASE